MSLRCRQNCPIYLALARLTGALRGSIDKVQERSADTALPATYASQIATEGVLGLEQGRRIALRDHPGVVEFVATEPRSGSAERAVGQQIRPAVAEMQLALGKAGDDRQQPGHGVAFAGRIDQPLAQHHVAAAFAIDRRAALSRLAQPAEEGRIGRQTPGMQFGIAAGQEDGVGSPGRRLVEQRREERQFRACLAPTLERGGIGETKGYIQRHGDALAEWWNGRTGVLVRREPGRPHQRDQSIEIQMRRQPFGQLRGIGTDIGMLLRLHQAEMPAGQSEVFKGRQVAQRRHASAHGSPGQHVAMPLAADLVEDHAGNIDLTVMPLQPLEQGGGRRGDALGAQHQHDRQAGQGGDLGRRSGRQGREVVGSDRRAVEQPHVLCVDT
eukprot:Opistho-1_new@47020